MASVGEQRPYAIRNGLSRLVLVGKFTGTSEVGDQPHASVIKPGA